MAYGTVWKNACQYRRQGPCDASQQYCLSYAIQESPAQQHGHGAWSRQSAFDIAERWPDNSPYRVVWMACAKRPLQLLLLLLLLLLLRLPFARRARPM